MKATRAAVAAVATLLALACGTRGERWEAPLVVEGPVAAADHLAFLDRTLSRLLVVGDSGTVESLQVPSKSHGLSSHGEELLFLARSGGNDLLVAVDPTTGRTSSIDVPRNFDRIDVSPSGATAILTFAPQPVDGPLVRNLNEVAVVDRLGGTSRLVSLSTGSLAPRQVLFAPQENHAAILLDDAVALLELGSRGRLIQIPLGIRGGPHLRPKKGLFAPDGARLYLLVDGADDVVAIDIVDTAAVFDASVNFLALPGARSLRDIAIAEGLEDGVVALWESDAAFLDGRGDTSRTLATAVPPGVERIIDLAGGLLFFHGNPGAPAATSASFAAWAPLEDRFGADRLDGRLLAEPRASGDTVLLPHTGPEGESAVSLVTVQREDIRLRLRQRPLALGGRPIASARDENGVFFLALQTSRPSDPWDLTGAVVSIDPASGETQGATLDREIEAFGLFGDSVFALHPSLLGDLTLLPRSSLRPKDARNLDGFFTTGMMEESR